MENQQNHNLKQFLLLIKEYVELKERDVKRKKNQSTRNKRYYQRHKDEILKKNKEMRDIYKLVKQN
jgi:hypothetical protein